MSADDLIKALLTSPVLVAVVTGFVAVFVGTGVNRLKDERIVALKEAHAAELKAKDTELAAAQLWSPAKMKEQVEAMMRLNEIRTEQLNAALERAEEGRSYSHYIRAGALEGELEAKRAELAEIRPLLEAAQASLARLESSGDDAVWAWYGPRNPKTMVSTVMPSQARLSTCPTPASHGLLRTGLALVRTGNAEHPVPV